MWVLVRALRTRAPALVRWLIAGGAFFVLNIPLLYGFHEVLLLPLTVASLIAGEIGALLRFVVNDVWVFKHRHLTWRSLAEYHAAVAAAFVIWWGVTNLLSQWGIHYLIASTAGTACSVGWNMATNFLWIWRPRSALSVAEPEQPLAR